MSAYRKTCSVFLLLLAAPVTADVSISSSLCPSQAYVNPTALPEPLGDVTELAFPEIGGSQSAPSVDLALQIGLTSHDALGLAQDGLPIPLAAGDHNRPANEKITAPGSPSGLMMALTGLLTVGGWQLTRSAKNVHFLSLPDWYHPGGPVQIGHAVVYELDLSLMPACCFEKPAAGLTHVPHLRWLVTVFFRGSSQNALTPAAPRGPPSLS